MSKKFSSLTMIECGEAYKVMYATAESEWEAGKQLAEAGKYGNATSLLIISIEEYVKSLLIFFDSKGFQFRNTKGVAVFFRNHQIRYVIAFIMGVMNLFGEEMKKALLWVKANPDEVIVLHKSMNENDQFFEEKFGYYLKRKLVYILQEFAWFKNADLFRQEGFYCDYKDFLKTPLKLSKKEFDEVYIRLEKVREVGKFLIQGFDSKDPSIQEQILRLKNDFKTKKYYDKIADALDALSKSKQNPFAFLKEKIGK